MLPFINKAVTPDCIKGIKSGVEKIVNTYDKDDKTFHIGNKRLQITPVEFGIIMGIASGSKDIDIKKYTDGPKLSTEM